MVCGEDDKDITKDGDILVMIPSTESQREIWTSAKMGQDATLAFNESVFLHFTGDLNVSALQRAVLMLIARHESLRATFSEDGALFCVANRLEIAVPCIDLSAITEQGNTLESVLVNEVETPFNLELGPLFRAQIVKTSTQHYVLVLTAHHIICDGWSYAIILKDLANFYMAEVTRLPSQLAPANSFHGYAKYMQERSDSPEYRADEAYWVTSFESIPTGLDLPTDRPRPAFRTYTSRREDYTLDETLVACIRKTGAKLGCSFVQTLLAAFDVLLYRLCGQDDLVIGLLAAGQAAIGQTNLVGHCVNTLPLRMVVDGNVAFATFLESVKKTMLNAYEHQQYTFGSLLQKLKIPRDPGRLPLCSVLFNIDQTLDANKLGFKDLDVQFGSNPRHYENFELFVNAVNQGGSVVLEVQYNCDLFDAATIRGYMSCFETLLRGIVAEPAQKISRLPILSWSEQDKMVLQWNATQAEFPVDATLHGLFSQQAAKTPDRIAVEFEGTNGLSYRALEERSNQLARYLQGKGVGRGTLVGLCINRSEEMLVTSLAVLKVGGAYVPLDPAYPVDRLGFMIIDSGLEVILVQSSIRSVLPDHLARVLVLDTEIAAISAQSTLALEPGSEPENLAYVIYTSGSTGKPKGVVVPHRAVVNFLTSMRRKPGITESDIMVAVTTLSFDIAVLELYLPIVTGAKTVIASRETALDGVKLIELLQQSSATMLQATPATWRLLILSGWEGKPGFKALCGGEALQQDLAEQLLKRVDSLWNMYGPTETTIWSTCERVLNSRESVAIGQPIDNTQLYILDALLQSVPVGVTGELYIGGAGVSLGYLHRDELTAERFVKNPWFDPFAVTLSPRLYKTGDVARYRADGRVEYVGRNDNQVKVRGYRIELGEIETNLSQYPDIQQCVVMIREDNPGDVRVVAYVTPKPGVVPDSDTIRTWLRTLLPDYMIPQHVMVLDRFPQTWNGKIDRKAFPPPAELDTHDEDDTFQQPSTDTELQIARIWSALLGKDNIGLHDNFFNLGGHSLLSIQFITQLQKETGFRLNPRLVLLNTLGQIARQVSANSTVKNPADNTSASGVAISTVKGLFNRLLSKKTVTTNESVFDNEPGIVKHASSTAGAPLSLKQERLWNLEKSTPGQTAYNLPSAFRMKGELNLPALQMSLNEVIRRYDIMRTTFVDGKKQAIMPKLELDLIPHDLSHLSPEKRELRLFELLANEAAIPFDLVRGPLIRASLYHLGELDNVLFFMPHHAIWDGWSFDIFLGEMATLYDAFSQNKSFLPPNPDLQYVDFAVWQRERMETTQCASELAFWLQELSAPLAVLKLPQQKVDRAGASYSGAMHGLVFSKQVTESLVAMGRKEGVTLSNVLLSAYNALLHVYSAQNDILVGVPMLGRNEPTVKNMPGYFVNTLPVRTRLTGENMTLRQLMNQTQDKMLEIYQHQDMSSEQLMSELEKTGHKKYDSLLHTTFSFQDASQRATCFGSLILEQLLVHSRGVAYDVTLWLKSGGQGLTGALEYRTDLFDASVIQTMAHDFETVLEAVLANPDITLGELRNRLVPGKTVKPARITIPDAVLIKPKNSLYFESGDKQIFGVFHTARSKTVRDKAILLCYPIGQEYIRSHWVFSQLAAQLASAGFPVLRFDYYATGDSYGESAEGNVTQWKYDVFSAARKLQSASGINQISIVGLRFGATLAKLAANEGLAIEDLILWDPVFSGQDYLKEIREIHTTLFNGKEAEEIMGYPYPQILQQQITAITPADFSIINACKTWIISTQDSEPEFSNTEIRYHHVKDGGDWDKLAEAHTRLICPVVIQTIVNVLAGRLP